MKNNTYNMGSMSQNNPGQNGMSYGNEPTAHSAGKQPLKKFRAGPISATVWSNEGQSKDGSAVSYSTISLERCYKDKNGEWQNTSSMRINDLPRAALVASKAYEYLVLNPNLSEADV